MDDIDSKQNKNKKIQMQTTIQDFRNQNTKILKTLLTHMILQITFCKII